MSITSSFESSETGRTEVVYSSLSAREIAKRIRSYEKKYGMALSRYSKQFSCDEALPWETSDLMDWESLVDEQERRSKKPPRSREMAYEKVRSQSHG